MIKALANHLTDSNRLCEDCGYDLSGLPTGTNCPECGSPVTNSDPALRGPTAWDRGIGLSGLVPTTLEVLFHPARFYRGLATRLNRVRSRLFAVVHWLITSLIIGAAVYIHFDWFVYVSNRTPIGRIFDVLDFPFGGILAFSLLTFLILAGTTLIAARLTHWEATYREYRLSLSVILRGLDFHAAHYLPIALVTAATIIGFRWLFHRNILSAAVLTTYLYILSAEVVISAAYLFKTYWIAMRNMMYANA